MKEHIQDNKIIEFIKNTDGVFILMPSLHKERRKKLFQPKCHLKVCRNSCPYKEKPFIADVISLANGNDAVCLLKEMKRGEWHSCVVMYLNGKCGMEGKSIEKNVFSFMRRHVARVMGDCPVRMEHLMSGWSNERRS